jgi:hypothetical protein
VCQNDTPEGSLVDSGALPFPHLSPSIPPPFPLYSPSIVPPYRAGDLKCAILAQSGVSKTLERWWKAPGERVEAAGLQTMRCGLTIRRWRNQRSKVQGLKSKAQGRKG